MAKKKNHKGYCAERTMDVYELNLCDYFQGKRKNSKPCCRNCVHFHLLETCKKDDPIDGVQKDDCK